MENKKKRPIDVNMLATQIIAEATQEEKPTQTPTKEKNPAAVALGRLGGLKGGKARAESLSAKKRKEIAQKAAKARWEKHHIGKSKS
jgi:hypothetical protein